MKQFYHGLFRLCFKCQLVASVGYRLIFFVFQGFVPFPYSPNGACLLWEETGLKSVLQLFHMCHPLTKPTSFIHLSRHCGSIKSLKPPLRSPPTQWQSSALLVCFIYIVIMCIHIYIYFLRTCTQTLFSFPGCYFCIELSGSSIQKAPFHKLTVSTMPVESTC